MNRLCGRSLLNLKLARDVTTKNDSDDFKSHARTCPQETCPGPPDDGHGLKYETHLS